MQQSLFATALMAFTLSAATQNDSAFQAFRDKEAHLQALQQETFYSKKEDDRFNGNKKFLEVWEAVVRDQAALTYEFRLKEVSILTPTDKSFRLITWNVPKDDGTHAYFGYLLTRRKVSQKTGWFSRREEVTYETHQLIDRSATIKSPETHSGSPDKWFGMLYTELIPCEDYYTLIGWDGNNKITTRKFVDVLWFKGDGGPVFGKDVFTVQRKNPRRLMFEYSSNVTMSLRYDDQGNQIVYSHLSSHKEGQLLEGQLQYYGPDGRFDALQLRKNKWVTVEDIDARNEKSKNDNDWNDPRKPGQKKHKKIMPERH